MTRIAKPENENSLLNMARYGIAGQLCRSALARDTCLCRPQAASHEIDEDGCWVLRGRFTPEQGAVIRQELEKAMDALFDERQDEHPNVSAETRGGYIRLAKRRAGRSRRKPCQPTAVAKSTTTKPRGCCSNTIQAMAEAALRH